MRYYINIDFLNDDEFDYLQYVFEDYDGDDFDSFYAYLTYIDDGDIGIDNYINANDFSNTILSIIRDVADDYFNLSLTYLNLYPETAEKKTVILDVSMLNEGGHNYLKEIFDFPDYYGKNLDALYDCLSELDETEVIIINMDVVNRRSLKMLEVIHEVSDDCGNIIINEQS